MPEVIFTLRTLTPLFLAGADQTKAELRAPSFRGLMRYWYRAMVGGLVGTNKQGLEEVVKAETEVFGATDTGSAVRIKVSGTESGSKEFTEQISINVGGRWQATGKGYLLWSMAKSGRADRGNLKPARWFFPPNTQFQVILSARNQDSIELKRAISAFWLLTYLGGIGSRSRRCAGSLAVQTVKDNPTTLTFSTPANFEALKNQLKEGIQTARGLYNSNITPRSITDAQFDVLAPGACRIWILQDYRQIWRSPEEAMRAIGESLQAYRSTIPLQQRKIFGLPLRDVSNARRASPLLLRVTQLQGGQYVAIAVLFKTRWKGVPMADYLHIEQWIAKSFPKSWKEEVTL